MDSTLASSTLRKVSRRLLPFLFVLYIVAWLDRVNVGFAALHMNSDLGFSSAAFGFTTSGAAASPARNGDPLESRAKRAPQPCAISPSRA